LKSLFSFWKKPSGSNPSHVNDSFHHIVAGLGNPGARYERTRHNVGFQLVERMAGQFGATWKSEKRFSAHTAFIETPAGRLLLVKPQTFMNRSGESLQAISRFYKKEPADFICVYDDITLPVGRAKLSLTGSAGGHNGVTDILQKLGAGFLRFRLGIGAKAHPEMDLKDHVLGRFSSEDENLFTAQIPNWIDQILFLVREGPQKAMNQINRS
jgi:PTH1 family peptidyl-tRNA hydrolase